MWVKYEREVYQFLSAYRFLSYGLAVMFTQVTTGPGEPELTDLQTYIVLSALGVYTLLKVFSPLRWRERSLLTYLILVGDFLICLLLVLFTGGLNSPFLLYSLTPIMTASLLFEERTALSLAAAASVSLSITHLILSRFNDSFASIMLGRNLTLLIVYTLFGFVIATLTYRTNMNIRRHIEREAIIEERRRIGREMHDGVAQSLGYLNLKTKLISDSVSSQNTAQALSGLDDIRKTVQDTYEDIREAIDQLSTETGSLSLIPMLTDYTQKFSGQSEIQVQLNVPKVFPRLSPVAELQLLRIAQEALTNVRRHASATRAGVKLEKTAQKVVMVVKDDGKGFILADLEKSAPGYHGLDIIKERAEGLGGTMTVSTAPAEGTEIMVSLPIEKVRL